MERALTLDGTLPPGLRDVIRAYNRKILAYSSDQIMPVRRPFGGRWFDDHTIPRAMIDGLLGHTRLARMGEPRTAQALFGEQGEAVASIAMAFW